MPNTCTNCSRICGDAYACKECTKTAINNLHHIADLAAAFDEKRAGVRSSWDVSNLGKSRPAKHWRTSSGENTTFAAKPTFTPSAALSFDPRVSRVQQRTQYALAAIPVPEHKGKTARPARQGPSATARWLISQVKWIRLQPDAGETFHAIERILTDLHHLFDNPPPALFLGECKAQFDDGPECTESIYLDRDKITGTEVTCPRCGITHDVAERRAKLMDDVNDHLGTAKEISRLLRNIAGTDVSERRIREYASHGLLPKMGARREYDRDGRPRDVATYRIGDVRDIATKVQQRRADKTKQRTVDKPRREQRVG